MKRAIVAVALSSALIASVAVAHAATLHVNAGILQTQAVDFEFVPPVTQTAELLVVARRYSGQIRNYQSTDAPVSFSLPADTAYHLDFAGTSYPCPGNTAAFQDTGGPFPGIAASESPRTHVICVQQGHSGISVTPVEGGGE